MSTSQQVQANRNNAAKSTGPLTPEGKAAIAQNARQHGLTGAFSILAHESRDEFQTLLAEYTAEFAPKSSHETFLVEEMAHARWTLARARRIETHVLGQLAGAGPADNPDARIAAALNAKSATALATVQRYQAEANRAYFRAHRVLTQGRSAEIRNKANAARTWLKEQIQNAPPLAIEDILGPDGAPNPVLFSMPPRPAPMAPATKSAPSNASGDMLSGSVPQ